ncbi:MAG: nucleotidyltransferase domain-containing protein [Candidatus Cyclonatronum sp.]|uniref:nucleotidyltransferase domain-containing protein n=1 Tax=Cyclonatronum sp. TaxID=3024185 RepID=UPI0025BD5CA6|nr:nucleotidyltransferase domain-containing protein [Cyclonatronum sp.]MCH8487764.1 nucleotidyltransferase domain-containing protein [Cyclonatronum sp.]
MEYKPPTTGKPVRLSEEEIATINQAAKTVFGDSVSVLLFGSRADLSQKGGDIDLLLQLPEPEKSAFTLDNKISFLVRVKKGIGDQKIDVVYDDVTKTNPTFLEMIREKAVLLNAVK